MKLIHWENKAVRFLIYFYTSVFIIIRLALLVVCNRGLNNCDVFGLFLLLPLLPWVVVFKYVLAVNFYSDLTFWFSPVTLISVFLNVLILNYVGLALSKFFTLTKSTPV